MSGARSAGELAALRAERLARLHGVAAAEPASRTPAVLRFRRPGGAAETASSPASSSEPSSALSDDPVMKPVMKPIAEQVAAPIAAEVAEKTGPAAACDLDRLPGAGPGLVWALRQAGFGRVVDLAALAPEDLALRLGPVGRLAPAGAWIAAARQMAG